MRLGIMQPYFFPYVGYFALIRKTDRWIVFDVAHYSRRSWMSRNRILHPRSGWQFISVPVCHAPLGTPLSQILVHDRDAAGRRILGQIAHYRGNAPYFAPVERLVETAFDQVASDRLVDLNVATQAAVCDYLDIPFHPERCSALGLDLTGVAHAGQWALAICEQLGAGEYLNPPGGRSIFRADEWRARNIRLLFAAMPQFVYECRPYVFVENLSVLDALMWNPAEKVRAAIDTIAVEAAW